MIHVKTTSAVGAARCGCVGADCVHRLREDVAASFKFQSERIADLEKKAGMGATTWPPEGFVSVANFNVVAAERDGLKVALEETRKENTKLIADNARLCQEVTEASAMISGVRKALFL